MRISVEGEWLRLDPERAYVCVGIDHSYLQNAGAVTTATMQPASSIAHRKLQKERIVQEGKTTWLILPASPPTWMRIPTWVSMMCRSSWAA